MVFSPPRAGNSASRCDANGRPSVHPRARGEFVGGGVFPLSEYFFHPRARGEFGRGAKHADYISFSPPPRAGNSSAPALNPARLDFHPRARGEFQGQQDVGVVVAFSPPRARGIRRRRSRGRGVDLFTPARAGNSGPCTTATGTPTFHPRARGEFGAPPSARVISCFSPPRARGIRRWSATATC